MECCLHLVLDWGSADMAGGDSKNVHSERTFALVCIGAG